MFPDRRQKHASSFFLFLQVGTVRVHDRRLSAARGRSRRPGQWIIRTFAAPGGLGTPKRLRSRRSSRNCPSRLQAEQVMTRLTHRYPLTHAAVEEYHFFLILRRGVPFFGCEGPHLRASEAKTYL